MRVILSRKGFDSQYGGIPNVVADSGLMLPLPIPYIKSLEKGRSDTFGSVYCADGRSVYELLLRCGARPCAEVASYAAKHGLNKTPCHVDPDLFEGAKTRSDGWRGCFGQEGAALGHLLRKGNEVREGDLFLFFGLFCEEGDLRLERARHMVYGYLQVGEVVELTGMEPKERKLAVPVWARDHPHVCDPRHGVASRNALFIAREQASWNASLGGWGLFSYSPELELTKAGMSCSRWDADKVSAFKGREPSYHGAGCWKADGGGYFQSRCRGQEFVFADEGDDGPVLQWAKRIIDIGMGRA